MKVSMYDGVECSISDCSNPARTKGYCKRHYQQLWATGSPEIKRPNPHGTAEERFWRYVDKMSDPKGCWLWTAQRDKDGYGKFRPDPKKPNIAAHRYSYQLHKGEITDCQMVRHFVCDNPPCVNPDHLRLGDHIDNMADRKASGHYGTGENHPLAKLTDAEAEAIRTAEGTNTSIAKQFGISESQVGNIKKGRRSAPKSRAAYCEAAEQKASMPTLFDLAEVEADEVEEMAIAPASGPRGVHMEQAG